MLINLRTNQTRKNDKESKQRRCQICVSTAMSTITDLSDNKQKKKFFNCTNMYGERHIPEKEESKSKDNKK